MALATHRAFQASTFIVSVAIGIVFHYWRYRIVGAELRTH